MENLDIGLVSIESSFCFSSQGPPGVSGLKGESGEAGPQVRDI